MNKTQRLVVLGCLAFSLGMPLYLYFQLSTQATYRRNYAPPAPPRQATEDEAVKRQVENHNNEKSIAEKLLRDFQNPCTSDVYLTKLLGTWYFTAPGYDAIPARSILPDRLARLLLVRADIYANENKITLKYLMEIEGTC